MIAIETISSAVNIGKLYYIELVSDYRDLLLDGGKSIVNPRIHKLKHLIRALSFDIAGGYNTQTTQDLYVELLKITSGYSGGSYEVDPKVVLNGRLVVNQTTGVTIEQVQQEIQEQLQGYALLGDRKLTGLEYSRVDSDITISSGTWEIDSVTYNKETSTLFSGIVNSAIGNQRYIKIYATTSNTILKTEGEEAVIAAEPTLPDNTLGLYTVLVGDAGVGSPVQDLSNYATKASLATLQSEVDAHEGRIDNPHSVTKTQIGLSNVDNTSDSTKNSATATLTNKTLTSPVINSPTGILKGDVGLGNVDNTSDVNKPVSTAQASADAATLASANTYTDTKVANLVDSSPSTLDTLNELANALGDDPNFATTVTTQIGLKEASANKSLSVTTDQASDIKYPSVKAVYDWAVGLFQTLSNKDATGGYAGLTLFKINFKNAANTFTSFFTNTNTAARTYTFQDRDGTIADNTDLALKANVAAATTTGTAVVFTEDKVYGSIATPETGNITADATGAKLGAAILIIHNSGTEPTLDSKFVKLSGSGDYTISVVNYIFCQYINATKILYSINQEA